MLNALVVPVWDTLRFDALTAPVFNLIYMDLLESDHSSVVMSCHQYADVTQLLYATLGHTRGDTERLSGTEYSLMNND